MDWKQFAVVASAIVSIGMAVGINYVRMKNMKKPVVAKKIVLPPMFMATGFSMYLVPALRPTFNEAIIAIIAGMLCSVLLIKTSSFEARDNQIFMQRSKLFLVILFGLLAIRMLAKFFLSDTVKIDPGEMSGLFFLLAFSMILPWRVGMFLKYKKLQKSLKANA